MDPLPLQIRLFYVRIFPCAPVTAPPILILSHLRRRIGVTLEINGSRVPASEQTLLSLRRDRLDRNAGEVTYLTTDNVMLTGSLQFEVCDGDGNLILCGSLDDRKVGWSMNCFSTDSMGLSAFAQPKLGILSPSIEVYVAGCFAGSPLILTQTIQLSLRKKDKDNTDEYNPEMNVVGHSNYPEDLYYEEDGQLSWFNAGVRVGVGISLGMCIGIGIGAGLLMRTYQTTTRSFKRRFF